MNEPIDAKIHLKKEEICAVAQHYYGLQLKDSTKKGVLAAKLQEVILQRPRVLDGIVAAEAAPAKSKKRKTAAMTPEEEEEEEEEEARSEEEPEVETDDEGMDEEQSKSNQLLVGRKVEKLFDGKLFHGEVRSYFKKEQFFRVVYDEDGDVEDYFLGELEPLLVHDLEESDDGMALSMRKARNKDKN